MKISRLINEGIGTFTAVLVSVGTAKLMYQEDMPTGNAIVTTAFILALIVALIYFIFRKETVHLNPLVSLAFFLNDEISFIDMLIFWSIQFFAALIAVIIVFYFVGPVNDTYRSISSLGSFTFEVIVTFLFVLFFLILVSRKGFSFISCVIIGFLLFVSIILLRPLNDSLLNPFITITDNFFQKSLSSEIWITLLGGVFGTFLAVLVFSYFFSKKKFRKQTTKFSDERNLDDEINLREDVEENLL